MTRYWIVVDNTHRGPYSEEQLKEMNLASDTYAWHPGLTKWTLLKDIPEFAEFYSVAGKLPDIEPKTETKSEVEVEIEKDVKSISTEEPQIVQPRQTPPPPPVQPTTPVQQVIEVKPTMPEKKPSSYLAWSIITTILFFLPVGIVAIIFSSKVNGYWLTGQYEKAYKASEKAAWFSNIAFVTGLIWFPFSMAFAVMLG